MRSKIFSAIALVILVSVLSSSAEAGYSRKLSRATESDKIYRIENMDATLIWNATFFSDDFRKAFESKHLKLHRALDDAEKNLFISEQQAQQDKYWEFFVGVYTKDDYKYFSDDSGSFWKVYLTAENGDRVDPVSISKVNITPYERQMFPYLHRWSRAYRILFPKVPLGDKFKLTATSVIGTSVLSWKIKR